jgi:hypothetical protein
MQDKFQSIVAGTRKLLLWKQWLELREGVEKRDD